MPEPLRWPLIGCAALLFALGGCNRSDDDGGNIIGDDSTLDGSSFATYLGSAVAISSPRYSGRARLSTSGEYRAIAGSLQLTQGSLAVGQLALHRAPRAAHTEAQQ